MESACAWPTLCHGKTSETTEVLGAILFSTQWVRAVLSRTRHRVSCCRAHTKLHSGRSHTWQRPWVRRHGAPQPTHAPGELLPSEVPPRSSCSTWSSADQGRSLHMGDARSRTESHGPFGVMPLLCLSAPASASGSSTSFPWRGLVELRIPET